MRAATGTEYKNVENKWTSQCTSSSEALGEGALRSELDLQLAGEVLLLEVLVLAHVTGDHALHLLGLQQLAQAEVIDAGVVGDAGQVPVK